MPRARAADLHLDDEAELSELASGAGSPEHRVEGVLDEDRNRVRWIERELAALGL